MALPAPWSLIMWVMPPFPFRNTLSGCTKDASRAGGQTIPDLTVTLWSRKKQYTPMPHALWVLTVGATRYLGGRREKETGDE